MLIDLKEKFKLYVEMTELVLSPIGGAWKNGEVLALPSGEKVTNLQAIGNALYVHLFGNETI